MPSHGNPIEEAFSKVKGLLRKVRARSREALVEAMGAALSAVSSQDARGFFGHRLPSGGSITMKRTVTLQRGVRRSTMWLACVVDFLDPGFLPWGLGSRGSEGAKRVDASEERSIFWKLT